MARPRPVPRESVETLASDVVQAVRKYRLLLRPDDLLRELPIGIIAGDVDIGVARHVFNNDQNFDKPTILRMFSAVFFVASKVSKSSVEAGVKTCLRR